MIQRAVELSGLSAVRSTEHALREYIRKLETETEETRARKQAAKQKRIDALKAWHAKQPVKKKRAQAKRRAQERWKKQRQQPPKA